MDRISVTNSSNQTLSFHSSGSKVVFNKGDTIISRVSGLYTITCGNDQTAAVKYDFRTTIFVDVTGITETAQVSITNSCGRNLFLTQPDGSHTTFNDGDTVTAHTVGDYTVTNDKTQLITTVTLTQGTLAVNVLS